MQCYRVEEYIPHIEEYLLNKKLPTDAIMCAKVLQDADSFEIQDGAIVKRLGEGIWSTSGRSIHSTISTLGNRFNRHPTENNKPESMDYYRDRLCDGMAGS